MTFDFGLFKRARFVLHYGVFGVVIYEGIKVLILWGDDKEGRAFNCIRAGGKDGDFAAGGFAVRGDSEIDFGAN